MARRLTDPALVAATFNKGKVAELTELLGAYGLHVVSASDLGLSELPSVPALHLERVAAQFLRSTPFPSRVPRRRRARLR